MYSNENSQIHKEKKILNNSNFEVMIYIKFYLIFFIKE